MDYRVGSIIEYSPFGGDTRRVTVDAKYDDIKNGRPGFDGTLADGMSVWGYDAQITSVVTY